MARREAAIEDLLATERPGLKEFIAERDARLDEDLEAQQRLIDRKRWQKVVRSQEDVDEVGEDEFTRDGLIAGLADFLTEHAAGDPRSAAQRGRAKRSRDPKIKWADEIDALRSCRAAGFNVRSGAHDKLAQQIKLGATIQTSVRNAEPTGDPSLDAVDDALAQLSVEDRNLLDWVHVGFEAPRQRTAHDLVHDEWHRKWERWNAAKDDPERGPQPEYPPPMRVPKHLVDDLVRFDERRTDAQVREAFENFARWLRNGRKIKEGEDAVEYGGIIEMTVPSAGAIAMARAGRLPKDSELLTDGLRWEHLVAERLGLNISRALGPIDPRKKAALEDGAEITDDLRMTYIEQSRREVRERYNAARERLRVALNAVELDCVCIVEQRDRERRGLPAKSMTSCRHTRWLIPAPTARELDDEARIECVDGKVECCAGIDVREGVRRPCEAVVVEGPAKRHPAAGWRRCDVCRKPVVEIGA